MKVVLLQTGKTSEKYISDGAEIFVNRIKKYIPFDIHTLPDLRNNRNMPLQEQRIKEGEKMISYFGSDDFVIALDENGREFTTIEFSEWLEKIFMLPKKRVVFVIGGPFGISDEVFKRAEARISLSKLTFSHQMVRLLFLEQLYRVLTIIKGDPYHHQ
jgi:23S rRNA (pseudouridine1915-N3)-methyltransferase